MQIRNDRIDFGAPKAAPPRAKTPAAPPARPALPAQAIDTPGRLASCATPDVGMASVDELGLLLHRLSLNARRLTRASMPAPLGHGVSKADEGRLADATVEHPVYGAYLGEWLETHRPDPGRALLGLLQCSMSELRSSISRTGDRTTHNGAPE